MRWLWGTRHSSWSRSRCHRTSSTNSVQWLSSWRNAPRHCRTWSEKRSQRRSTMWGSSLRQPFSKRNFEVSLNGVACFVKFTTSLHDVNTWALLIHLQCVSIFHRWTSTPKWLVRGWSCQRHFWGPATKLGPLPRPRLPQRRHHQLQDQPSLATISLDLGLDGQISKLLSRVDAYFKCWGISFRAEAAGPNLNKTFQFDLTSFLDDFVAKLAECQKTLFSSGDGLRMWPLHSWAFVLRARGEFQQRVYPGSEWSFAATLVWTPILKSLCLEKATQVRVVSLAIRLIWIKAINLVSPPVPAQVKVQGPDNQTQRTMAWPGARRPISTHLYRSIPIYIQLYPDVSLSTYIHNVYIYTGIFKPIFLFNICSWIFNVYINLYLSFKTIFYPIFQSINIATCQTVNLPVSFFIYLCIYIYIELYLYMYRPSIYIYPSLVSYLSISIYIYISLQAFTYQYQCGLFCLISLCECTSTSLPSQPVYL